MPQLTPEEMEQARQDIDIWKEGNCIRCGLKQNCLIEEIKNSPISFWKCTYCDEIHTIKKGVVLK